MRLRIEWLLSLAWIAAAGCTTILGINGPYTRAESSGGGGATTTTAGTGGQGGMVTTGTTTGTGGIGGSGGAGGQGGQGGSGGGCVVVHPGGGSCEYLPGMECGCGADQKCSVTIEATGQSGCVLIGSSPLPAWASCNTDADCAAGTFCAHALHVCKPICDNVAGCGAGGQCAPEHQAGSPMAEIPGLRTCTAHCDPQTAMPCGDGTTCYYDVSAAELDCAKSKKLGVGADCSFVDDCDRGLVCVGGAGTSTCQRWCHPVDAVVPSAFCQGFFEGKNYCLEVAVQVEYGGNTYGVCSP